jgi:hypothetical protein
MFGTHDIALFIAAGLLLNVTPVRIFYSYWEGAPQGALPQESGRRLA